MKFYSTKRSVESVSFKEAVIKGLPEDNGLFMPEYIPQLSEQFFANLNDKSIHEIGLEVAYPFVGDDISKNDLEEIVTETLNFDIPVVRVEDNVYSLELFHGPTCAFKDVGARFLARCLSQFSDEKVTVLVATSGDTGSAVANGFLGVPNVDVVILYPKGKVSHLQEQQLTTLGQNITALEVDGTFDDCQALVKTAFLDKELNESIKLTSANSINIARLIPQSFYYFWAMKQLPTDQKIVFSVPSGNYGNLTAGLLAKAMGLGIKGFVASSNANDIVPQYLNENKFKPRPSVQTISNAMDVGNPSNFGRMTELYQQSWDGITKDITGYSFLDGETKTAMKKVFDEKGYILDPHGAVGYLGLKSYMKNHDCIGVFLETAHPAKFLDTVNEVIGEVEIPERLAAYLDKTKVSIPIANDYEALKEILVG
ncbi:threonine synthase [Fulvivirga lutimaris]|uniref:threonine synthase n=1 Tax=Fulvivirga lutimaris TaxID=1819566 RepID=UPI0012BB5A3C|nr:threonine synthase [Fulvivirga lutimaris]MTI40993.1 threonine synthase [Fulvivirga lutimaris]